VITANSIYMRFGEQLGIERASTFGEAMPFYKGSLFADIPTKVVPDRPIRRFVQFDRGNKVKAYGGLTKAKQANKRSKVERYLNATSNLKDLKAVKVHIDDWAQEYLQKLTVAEVVYMPAPLSTSADLFYFAQSRASTHVQDKAGLQLIDENMIGAEAALALPAACGMPLTFVMVGFNVDDNLKARDDAKLVSDLAIRFESPSSFSYVDEVFVEQDGEKKGKQPKKKVKLEKQFVLPNNMDIIVLLPPGVDLLLTKANADLLRSQSYDIESFVGTVAKPYHLPT